MPLICSATGPLPNMHFPKQLSIDRNNHFKYDLLPALNLAMPPGKSENSCFIYSTAAFVRLLTDNVILAKSPYLGIYFASIDERIDLIYAVRDPNNSSGQLFFIFAKNQFIEVVKGDPFTPGTASFWVTEFITKKISVLQRETNIQDITRMLSFTAKQITEFINEISFQQPTSIKAYFSLYLDSDDAKRRRRVFVNFVFGSKNAAGDEEDSYIDDCGNFPGRQRDTMILNILHGATDLQALEDAKGFDNSTMCPPETTCSSILP